MNTQKIVINLRKLGYKSSDKAIVSMVYSLATVKCDLFAEVLGDTMEVVKYSTFDVDCIDALAAEVLADTPHLTNMVEARQFVSDHLKSIVDHSILFGDNSSVNKIA